MKIQLRFFASVREKLGVSAQTVEVPEEIKTVGDVRAWLALRGADWAETLSDEQPLRTAHDHVMCEADTLIEDGKEVAFFPPVTGG
ncbi:molybdopterin converting factor subunit 1 [Undibacterium jejuense]|uniref:Molybdopterin converting factor subunit 1 n=1 Tax=Undibacterium jejuense TaxID=1344949 RepID=A0A923HH65_9BURK|nr:molybdopterin converting factor subunit 1 [Undibacterium jejuense]MBC3861572.1 molybdopterin converting factor subunit 1 [Undibacterium jejuense]